MTGNGTVIASIPAGVAVDAAGNGNSISTSTDNTVTYVHLLRIYLPVTMKQP
jgi:hypothetical protein